MGNSFKREYIFRFYYDEGENNFICDEYGLMAEIKGSYLDFSEEIKLENRIIYSQYSGQKDIFLKYSEYKFRNSSIQKIIDFINKHQEKVRLRQKNLSF